jgi:hypothetical protein
MAENLQKATDATEKQKQYVYNVPIQFSYIQKSTLIKGRNSFKGKV